MMIILPTKPEDRPGAEYEMGGYWQMLVVDITEKGTHLIHRFDNRMIDLTKTNMFFYGEQ